MTSECLGDRRSGCSSDDTSAYDLCGNSTSTKTETPEAIAVVGYAIGLPQDIDSADMLWEAMMTKRNTATVIPKSRMNADSMYHPDTKRKGQISVLRSHFMEQDIASFDAPFFSISTTDAANMDPQQRLLLEYTYLALENAGIPMEKAAGTRTSVYTGSFSTDWQHLSFKDSEECGATSALGAAACFNANRVSWFFDFLGNSANVDTACSSSLVCLDMGCQGLRNGEDNMSVVAGSNIMFSVDNYQSLTNLNMLSPDGQCYSFDHRGNGYSRGEGFCVLILKRISTAIRDGDTLRGIIRSTGCNQDGKTTSITLPNRISQENLIRETYRKAGLSMDPVRFFEAHGTGTLVGDPIESKAFGSVFRRSRSVEDPLWVGALKANFGHLEGASGLVGMVKTMMALEKGVIPPNTNFEKTNPQIDTEFLHIKFPLQPTPWPVKGIRRASVNSFGNGGTNAHVILDDVFHFLNEQGLAANHTTTCYPPSNISESWSPHLPCPKDTDILAFPGAQKTGPRLLVFSASDEKGTERQAKRYASYFSKIKISPDQDQTYLDNLAYTLSDRRSLLAWRSCAVVDSSKDLRDLDKSIAPRKKCLKNPGVAFIFTGQGAQWANMGRELMEYPKYQQSVLKSEEYLLELGCPWRLREELLRTENSSINRPDLSQPLCTAIQIAIVDLLLDLDVYPAAVIGHSSGEIAAAYCTGAISDRSALKLAYHRGSLANSLTVSQHAKGAMISLGLSKEDAIPYIEKVAAHFGRQGIIVACINSPQNVTISGDEDQIDFLKEILEIDQVFNQKLLVEVAYHSPHMQAIAEDYREKISDLQSGFIPGRRPAKMISSVTGQTVTNSDLLSPDYWVSNMVLPVNFIAAIMNLCSKRAYRVQKKLDLSHRNYCHADLLVEIGPHSALQRPINETISHISGSPSISYVSCLIRNTAASKSFLNAFGQIHCLGIPTNIGRVNFPLAKDDQHSRMALPDLPAYPYDHSKRYWEESRISSRYRLQPQGKLDLLGKPIVDWNPMEPRWRNHLRVSEMSWIEEHVIHGSLIYPGAGMLVMAIEAANQMSDPDRIVDAFEMKEISFSKSLGIPQDANGIETQLTMRIEGQPASNQWSSWSGFRLFVYEKGVWYECCNGHIRTKYKATPNILDKGKEDLAEVNECQRILQSFDESHKTSIDLETFYGSLQKNGIKFGPSFHRVREGAFNDQAQVIGRIAPYKWPQNEFPQPHIIHPTTLDAVFHLALAGHAEGGNRDTVPMVPSFLRRLFLLKDGLNSSETTEIHECAWLKSEDSRGTEYGAFVLDSTKNALVLQFDDLRLAKIGESAESSPEETASTLQTPFHVEYRPDPELLEPKKVALCCTQGLSRGQSSLDRFVGLINHKLSELKILEIGIGDKCLGTTVLQALPVYKDSYTRFCYAGTSEILLEQAKKVYQDYPYVSFQVLRIDEDPLSQGLETDYYDIILAPDAIRYSEQILCNMRKVLGPAGNLLLFSPITYDESTTKMLFSKPGSSFLSECGFLYPGLPLFSASGDPFHAHSVFRRRSDLSGDDTPVFLVYDAKSSSQGSFCETFTSFLTSHQFVNVTSGSLEEASSLDHTGKTIFVVILELDHSFLYTISGEEYSLLRKWILSASNVLWLNTQGGSIAGKPEYALIHGFFRALQREHDHLRLTITSLEPNGLLCTEQLESLVQIMFTNHTDDSTEIRETEFLEIDGILNIPRIVPAISDGEELHSRSLTRRSGPSLIREAPPLTLALKTAGLLDTLHFIEDERFLDPLLPDEVEVETKAIGTNFKDCLIALGQISNASIGLECSGVVTRAGGETRFSPGDRILMAAPDIFKTFARCKACRAFRIPDNLSFTTAAAIPAQFGTAWAVIHNAARLRKGETILIHAGAGGTGQAAIQIAQLVGATIFATVGSQSKKRLLIDEYNVPEEHIFYSRDVSFAKGIKRLTKDRGVDVVINSLAGEALLASWNCIAPYGRFVEIGKRDILTNSSLPMSLFGKNASFIGFDGSMFFKERPAYAKDNMQKLVDMFADGTLHPPRPLHIYDVSEVENVFKMLQNGTLSGKAVLEVTQDSRVKTTLDTKPSFQLQPNATYIIAGGLGGLGRATARWMASRNARHLVLLSRSGPRTGLAFELLEELRKQGVRVEAPACDITKLSRMEETFRKLLIDMPPIKGCFQASIVAKDCLFESLDYEDWKVAVDCKTVGSWNLHSVLPSGMDFFVMLSSASGLSGVRGQTNYDAGNTYEDALARYRVSNGEKAITFDLGAMSDDGILAENPELLNRVLGYGTLEPVTRKKYYAILDYYCNPSRPVSSITNSQVAIGLGLGGGSGLESVNFNRLPLLRPLDVKRSRQAAATGALDHDQVDYRKSFAASKSLDEAGETVTQAVVGKLAKSLSTMQDGDSIDMYKPLQMYGVDSLLAIELRNWIVKEFAVDIAVFELQGAATLCTLSLLIAGRSSIKHESWLKAAEGDES